MLTTILDLTTLYTHQLSQIYSIEAQATEALPRLTISASFFEVWRVVEGHAARAVKHKERTEALLRCHRASQTTHADQVAGELLHKAEMFLTSVGDPDLRDAALVASLRMIGHYKVAAYITAVAYAKALSFEIDRRILQALLAEERQADCELESLEGETNHLALLVSTPAYL